MDVGRRRAGIKATVVAGSVWESRMKLDEVKGGIKVFNGEDNNSEQTAPAAAAAGGGGVGGGGDVSPVTPVSSRKVVRKGPAVGTSSNVGVSGKRKTWKSEVFDGPIQIARGRTEPASNKNSEEQCRELSVSTDGLIKKSPVQVKKGRSESVDGIVKNPIQAKKGRSDTIKDVGVGASSIDGNEKSPSQARKSRSEVKEVVESGAHLRKVKSDAAEVKDEPDKDVEKDSHQLRKVKSESDKVVEGVANEIEKSPPEAEENGSEDTCKEFGVCQEKVISSTETSQTTENHDNGDDVIEDDEGEGEEELEGDEEEEEVDEEIEVEKKSVDIKEIKVTEEKPKRIETSSNIAEQKPVKNVEIRTPEQKPIRKVVNEERKVHQFSNRAAPPSPIVNKQPPPVMRRAAIYQNLTKQGQIPVADADDRDKFQPTGHSHSKLQNLVDLVMWRDISRSAFAFGIGTFIIISSSYTKDLNVSFISVMSYLGLVYLATIFLYRSLICRGLTGIDDNSSYVLGEDEAIWLMKLVLPYLNECLLKIRALFSGDPSTTMKMAVLLFVLARCGSSITIWKMAKLGFFGVFTVPKVCSLYSTHITAYAKFWIRRFRDAWDSCTHKKAVALGIFTLVWNLSSMVARIWAIFMMYVAVRYYQQTMENEDWVVEEEEEDAGGAAKEEKWSSSSGGGQIHQKGAAASAKANSLEVNKAKKKY